MTYAELYRSVNNPKVRDDLSQEGQEPEEFSTRVRKIVTIDEALEYCSQYPHWTWAYLDIGGEG